MLVFTPLIVSPWETIAAFTFILLGIPVWVWRVKHDRRSMYCCDTQSEVRVKQSQQDLDMMPAHPGLNRVPVASKRNIKKVRQKNGKKAKEYSRI
jgi:hypothetical protein